MNELPCIGFAITVIDPGPIDRAYAKGRKGGFVSATVRLSRGGTQGRLLRAYVTEVRTISNEPRGAAIFWKSGSREAEVWEKDEHITWCRGHGPQARTALLAARALR